MQERARPAKTVINPKQLMKYFLSGRCTRVRNGKSCAHTIRAEENAGAGKLVPPTILPTHFLLATIFKFTLRGLVGFDKPQKNLSRRFGGELALPVWVVIERRGLERYPPREITRRQIWKEIEICSSRVVATINFTDAVKA